MQQQYDLQIVKGNKLNMYGYSRYIVSNGFELCKWNTQLVDLTHSLDIKGTIIF